ncbi:MAG: hypothetical protein KKG01_03080, partial [Candidatus Omnitrophica bacterium]|nr:hypothetical protein [Candidatus Omnitrophota bacterium]
MLDWQGKKWVKAIAICVVVAFLSYDIAWATDFSSIVPMAATLPAVPETHPKIDISISEEILKKAEKEEEPEETEISFRSQLIPRKKYGERSGFQRVETMKEMKKRQKDELRRRKQIEEDRRNRNITDYNINKNLYLDAVEKAQEAQALTQQDMKARGETMGAAAAVSEFKYVLNKDGSRVNYIDGLPSSIQNERIVDALGQASIKNTWDMKYDERRLLVSYNADMTDHLGRVTTIDWSGATYTPDSVFYADDTTNANKLLTGYHQEITDHEGNVTVIDWSGATYDGKDLKSYHEEIVDSKNPNVTIARDVWDMEYDSWGDLIGYKETSHTYGMDSNGNQVDLTSTTVRSDAILDASGGATGWTEITTTQGTDLGGNEVDLTVEVKRDGIERTPGGSIKGYTDTIHKTGTGEDTFYFTEAWDELTEEQKQDYLAQKTFIINDELVSWTDLSESDQDALLDGESINIGPVQFFLDGATLYLSIDSTTKIERSGMKYYGNGRLSGYHEVIIDLDAPALATERDVSMLCYNFQGQLAAYNETITSGGLVSHAERRDIIYNSHGQQIQETYTTHMVDLETNGLILNITSEGVKTDITYDALGRLTGYNETTTNDYNNITTSTTLQDITYNSLGQETGWVMVSNTTGQGIYKRFTGIEASDGSVIDLTDLTESEQLRLLAGESITIQIDGKSIVLVPNFEETEIDLDMEVRTVRSHIEYNEKGQVASYKEVSTQTGFADEALEIAALSAREFAIRMRQMANSARDHADELAIDAQEAQNDGADNAEELALAAKKANERAGIYEEIAELAEIAATKIEALAGAIEMGDEELISQTQEEAVNTARELGDKIEDYLHVLEVELDAAQADLELLEDIADETEKALDKVREFEDAFRNYEVTSYEYDGDRITKKIKDIYTKKDGKDVLIGTEITTYQYDENGNITEELTKIYKVEEDGRQNLIGKEVITSEYTGGLLTIQTKETLLVTSSGSEILLGKETIDNKYKDGKLEVQVKKRYEQVEIEDGTTEVLLVSCEVSTFEYTGGLLTTETIDRYDVDPDDPDGIRDTSIKTEVITYGYDQYDRVETETSEIFLNIDGESVLVAKVETTNQYDVDGNCIYQLQTRSEVDGEDVLVGKLEIGFEYDGEGNLIGKVTTTYEIKDEEAVGYEIVTEEYDSEARVISQTIEKYEIRTAGEDLLVEKTVKNNFQYDTEHPDLILGFTLETYEVDEYGDANLSEAKIITLEEIERLSREDEIAQANLTKAEQKASSLYKNLNSTRFLLQEAETLSNAIPYEFEIITTTNRSNMQYNDKGQLTDYVEVSTQEGMAEELVWRTLDKAGDLQRWASYLAANSRDKAEELRDQALAAEPEEAEALIAEAERLEREAEEFERIANLAQIASEKARSFIDALETEDQGLIEAARVELLDAQDALGDKIEDFIWAIEEELGLAEDIVGQLEKIARTAQTIAAKAQEIADEADADASTQEERAANSGDPADEAEAVRLRGLASHAQEKADGLQEDADIARANADAAKDKVNNIEKSLSVVRRLEDASTALFNTIPFQLDLVINTTRSNMQYNDRGQLTDYIEVTNRQGMALELAYRALDKAGDLQRWASYLASNARDKAEELRSQALAADSDEDAQALLAEADRIDSETEEFERIAALAETASQKAQAFIDALKTEDHDLIEAAQSELLDAQDALGDKIEDFVIIKEGELAMIKDEIAPLQQLARETQDARDKAQEIADQVERAAIKAEEDAANNPADEALQAEAIRLRGLADLAQGEADRLQGDADAARTTADRAKEKVENIENSLTLGRRLEEASIILSNTIPFQLDLVITTTRSDMEYNDKGQLTDYIEVTNRQGMAKELACRAMDKAGDLQRWAQHLATNARDKARELRNEAVRAEVDERYGDAQALRDEAERLDGEADEFDRIAALAEALSQKAQVLIEALEAEDQDLIDAAHADLLLAQDALGDKVEDFVRAKEEELGEAREELAILQRLANETEQAAKEAEDLARILGRYEVKNVFQDGNVENITIDTYEVSYDGTHELVKTEEITKAYDPLTNLGTSETTISYDYIDGEKTAVKSEVAEYLYEGNQTTKTTLTYQINTYGTPTLIGKEVLITEYDGTTGRVANETRKIYGIETDGGTPILIAQEVTSNTYEVQGSITVQTQIKEFSWVEPNGDTRVVARHEVTNEYDSEDNLIYQSILRYAMISEEPVLVGKKKIYNTYYSDGTLKTETFTYDIKNQEDAGVEIKIDVFDADGRLEGEIIARYKITDGVMADFATEKLVRKDFIYDTEHPGLLLSYTIETYEITEIGGENLIKTQTISPKEVHRLRQDADLARAAADQTKEKVERLQESFTKSREFEEATKDAVGLTPHE